MLLDVWLSGTDTRFILLQRFSSPAQLMTHFLDVSTMLQRATWTSITSKRVFKNKAWSDLPVFMKLRGNPNFDYKTQHFIQEQSNGNYTVIKHVFLIKQRLPQAKLEAFAMGKCYEIAWGYGKACGAESSAVDVAADW